MGSTASTKRWQKAVLKVVGRWAATGMLAWELSVGLAVPLHAEVVITDVVHGRVEVRPPQTQLDGRIRTDVVQSTARAIVHASDFNIAPNHVVNVIQPNVSSWMLARVFGPATHIDGALNATGSLILLNPNGVLIGPTGQVNVGGLFAASTLAMSNSNFLNGVYLFQDSGTNGIVRNAGTINAGVEGVYLFAPNVENAATGVITSQNGQVTLGAGRTAFLSNRPDGRGFFAEVTAPAGEALNLGQLLADGGQVTMAGRVVNQGNLVQANSVVQRNGRIELVASERITLQAGSRTNSSGSEEGAHGGTVVAWAADRDAGGTRINGVVTVEAGAVVDVGPAAGGVAGEVWLGGTVTANGLVHRLIPNQVTLGDSQLLALASNVGRGEVNVLAMDDIRVTVGPSAPLDYLAIPSGQRGTFHLLAGRDLTWTNSRFASQSVPWNIVARARNDVIVNASEVSTTGGASIHLHAGRDLSLVDGSLTFARVHTANLGHEILGGDISLTALRDIVAPSPFGRSSDGISLPGIHVGLPGNLTIRAGQDLRGPAAPNPMVRPRAFGFTLQGGIADVAAGRDIGSDTAPVNLVLGGFTDNGDGTYTVPAAAANLNAGRSIYFSLAEDFGLREAGILTANGTTRIDTGTVLRTPLITTTRTDESTGLPIHMLPTQLNLAARTGDVLIQQDRPTGAFANERRLLPSVFSARADQGNVTFVTGSSPLRFWPSNEGRIQIHAHQAIRGLGPLQTVPDQNSVLIFTGLPSDPAARWVRVSRSEALADPLLARWFYQWGDLSFVNGSPLSPLPPGLVGLPPASIREKPLILERSTSPGIVTLYPGDVRSLVGRDVTEQDLGPALQTTAPRPLTRGLAISFSTEQGDIESLQLNFLSPFLGQTTISSGGDIRSVLLNISTPQLPGDRPSAIVHAGGSIDLTRVPGFNTSGIRFFGNGTAEVRANGNLNLGDSFGIIHLLGNTRDTVAQRRQGGVLDIGIGGRIEMTQSQIATFNGAAIFIHGADGVRVADEAGRMIPGAVEVRTLLVDRDGTMVLALPNESGTAVPIQAYRTVLPVGQTIEQNVFTAQDVSNGRLELVWKPLFVEQTGQLFLVGGQRVRQGDQSVFQEKVVAVDLNPARGSDGTPILVDGRPALVDGRIVLEVGGQRVSVVTPVGGGVNIGGTVATRNAEEAGIVTLRGGDITILATGDVDVNRSRVGTFDSGNILIKSTSGTINAGSGSRNERSLFVIDNGDGTSTPATVPGSGIFTWERDDPDMTTLPFPKFDTPAMEALKVDIAKRRFLGRDTSDLEARFNRLSRERTVEYDRIFEEFIAAPFGPGSRPLQLGDISLIAARNIDVPSAGIRGRRINLEAGESLNLLGGLIIGKTTFTASTVSGSIGAFAGAAAGSVGGASVSAAGGAGGSSVGGLSGVTSTVSATSAATSTTSSTAAKSVEQVQQTAEESAGAAAPAAQPGAGDRRQVASADTEKSKKAQAARSMRMGRGVIIQVDVKPATR
ncbi:MAG: filamentous hemagglutinin N-terminal domain-containing protein [Nitrospira sp.]|nr:filamentous hemagglutinin N-terminal domain-containing protein [Nitrospira sp.]